MSTNPNTLAVPIMTREQMVDLTREAYERSNTYVDRDVLDLHLAEVADQAACSLLRDRWEHAFPIAAYSELLTTVAALRSILGYTPSPTAAEVSTWSQHLYDATAAAAGDDRQFHDVQLHGGPYNGVVVVVWGPKAPPAPGVLAGPPLVLDLPTERGDSQLREYGTVRYDRVNRAPDSTNPLGRWDYHVSVSPLVAAGTRPRLLPAAPDRAGA